MQRHNKELRHQMMVEQISWNLWRMKWWEGAGRKHTRETVTCPAFLWSTFLEEMRKLAIVQISKQRERECCLFPRPRARSASRQTGGWTSQAKVATCVPPASLSFCHVFDS
ncbi:hypothetical protein BKA80DRAFT_263609 [Phyllosticta citrichinensis]